MNRKIIYVGAVSLAVVITLFFVFSGNSTSGTGGGQKEKGGFSSQNLWENINLVESEKIMSQFQSDNLYTYAELVALAEKGKIDLRNEIWNLRRQCPQKSKPQDCDYAVLQYLKKNFPPEFAEMFEKFTAYEKEMRESSELKDLKDDEKYARIKEIRRKYFTPEQALLIFGREEAKMEFAAVSADYMRSSQGKTGDQRMKEYNSMRQKVYGDFYEGIMESQPPFDEYQTELAIRGDDWKKIPDSDRQAKTNALRVKYFGQEGARRLAELDSQLAKESANEAEYQAQKDKLMAISENMSPAEKETMLDDLRKKYFGKEADSYKQREIYRQYIQSQKK